MYYKSAIISKLLSTDQAENSIMQTISIAISAILIAAGLVTAPGLINNARDNNARTDLANIAYAEEYQLSSSSKYVSFETLVEQGGLIDEVTGVAAGIKISPSGKVTNHKVLTCDDPTSWLARATSSSGKTFYRSSDSTKTSHVFADIIYDTTCIDATGFEIDNGTTPPNPSGLTPFPLSMAKQYGFQAVGTPAIDFTSSPFNSGASCLVDEMAELRQTSGMNYKEFTMTNAEAYIGGSTNPTPITYSGNFTLQLISNDDPGQTDQIYMYADSNIAVGDDSSATRYNFFKASVVQFNISGCADLQAFTFTNTDAENPEPNPNPAAHVGWEIQTAPTGWNYSDLAYGNNMFVATASGAMITSPDGINWTERQFPGQNFMSITFGNGVFIVFAYASRDFYTSGYATNQPMMISSDGINWTETNAEKPYHTALPAWPGSDNWSGPEWGVAVFTGDRFVISTSPYSDEKATAVSTDGMNWTKHTYTGQNIYVSAYGNGVLVAQGNNETALSSDYGVSWTNYPTSPIASTGRNMSYVNGQFIQAGTGGFLYSSDAITWHKVDVGISTQHFNDVIYSEGEYTMVGSEESFRAWKSTDGINWTHTVDQHIAEDVAHYFMAYGGGKIVTLAPSGSYPIATYTR